MSDKASGRDDLNSGSDSAKHHTGTAAEQHHRAPKAERSVPVTGQHPNGYVGNNGKPPKADERSAVK
ncbi:hypothetical protein PQR05_03925 [Paraburkholderia sediminicola]|uniref:hypothetical protein n=1 Tax=Paraburkholderia sediminicola TaxID=458836 RepID=UPI0038BDBCA5